MSLKYKEKHPSMAATSTGEKFVKKMNSANYTINTYSNSPRTIWATTLFVKLSCVLVTKQQSPLTPNVKAGTKQANPSSSQQLKKQPTNNIDCKTEAILPMTNLPTSNSNSNKSTSVIMTSSTWPRHVGIVGLAPTYTTCNSIHVLHGRISTYWLAVKLLTTNTMSKWP